jgi:hypothetical protein
MTPETIVRMNGLGQRSDVNADKAKGLDPRDMAPIIMKLRVGTTRGSQDRAIQDTS